MANTSNPSALPLVLSGAALLLAGGAAAVLGGSSASAGSKAEIEGIVREYILAHPEILPEAMENIRKRETGKQLGAVGGKLEVAFPVP